ncbi:MAG TPA: efflux RND transporter periplasmic adaptor subunit, partial [Desulfomonilia bacterium]|nr:efflux RND transporter periplasmic adaptor subunit [Desulfomonilia bacterium]
YPVLDGQTRTLRVRCTLENPDLVLRPQMFASVELRADLGTRLTIPEDAVMDTGERQLVYVDRGEGMFEPRRVSTGISAGGRREILSGLKAGEKVAASALFLIDSEAQLKGVAPAAP